MTLTQDEEKARTRAFILRGMEVLFERAEREGLWFYAPYHDLWFSPAELRAAQAEGRFVWAPANWTLQSPQLLEAEAEDHVRRAQEHLAGIRARITRAKGGGR